MAKSAKRPSGDSAEDAAEVRDAGDAPAAEPGTARGRVRAPSKRARRSAAPASAEEAGEEIAPEAGSAAETGAAAVSVDPPGEPGEPVGGGSEDEWAYEIESSYLQSKYTLVSVAAKRARQLLEGSRGRVESLSDKPVTVALEELAQGKLLFEPVREAR